MSLIRNAEVDSIDTNGSSSPAMPGETRVLRPEEKLLYGILEQAIRDYIGRGGDRDRTAAQEEAEDWFRSLSTEVHSFRWVCANLNLDPDYVWHHRFDWQFANRGVGTHARTIGGRGREAA